MRSLHLLSTFALAALGVAAHAQLVFGSTTTANASNPTATPTSGAFYLNLATTSATRLWSGTSNRKVNGMAADTANGVIYSNDAARLNRWTYGNVGTSPTALSGLYRPSAAGGTLATGVDGLAFARGNLYAYTDTATLNAEDGIYLVNPNIAGSGTVANMSLVWQHPDKAYNFEGFEYDPVTELFYATNTVAASAPTTESGIYAIDLFAPTVTVTKIASFDPTFNTNPDGLTIGNGKIWLSSKPVGNQLFIESFDLTSKTFGDRLSFTIAGTDTIARSTGLTWAPGALNPVPEPASMLALGAGALALLRRRRK